MNTINRFKVGRKCYADLFKAIDAATAAGCNVVNNVTGLIVWCNPE